MIFIVKPIFEKNGINYNFIGGKGTELMYIIDILRDNFTIHLDFQEENGLFMLNLEYIEKIKNIYEYTADVFAGKEIWNSYLKFEVIGFCQDSDQYYYNLEYNIMPTLLGVENYNIDQNLTLYIPDVNLHRASIQYFVDFFEKLNIGIILLVKFKITRERDYNSGEMITIYDAYIYFKEWNDNMLVQYIHQNLIEEEKINSIKKSLFISNEMEIMQVYKYTSSWSNQEEEDMENDEDKYLLKTEKTATEVAEFLLKEDDENGEGSNFMDSRFKKFYRKI
jgi:hypothetical protein